MLKEKPRSEMKIKRCTIEKLEKMSGLDEENGGGNGAAESKGNGGYYFLRHFIFVAARIGK